MDPRGLAPGASASLAPWNANHESKVCECCRVTAFTFIERKHHCRHCGRVVCSACSKHRTHHEHYKAEVRTCDGCLKSIVRRQSLEVGSTVFAVPGSPAKKASAGAAAAEGPSGQTATMTVEVFECERWDASTNGGWSAQNLKENEGPWQTRMVDGVSHPSLAAFEARFMTDKVVVGWVDSGWTLDDSGWEYRFKFPGEGSQGGWVTPADGLDANELEARPSARCVLR